MEANGLNPTEFTKRSTQEQSPPPNIVNAGQVAKMLGISRPCPDGCGVNCNSRSTSGQAGSSDHLLEQAGRILFKLSTGQYKSEQYEGAFDVLDAILRRYYTRASAVA